MHTSKKTFRWLAFTCVLIGAFGLSMALYKIVAEPSAFLTIRSPGETYTVTLTGQKERPTIFTAEVRFHVLKNGKSFWLDQYFHSGDAFDLSFEGGYPDYRWLDDNILQFYREQNFSKGKPQVIILINKTDKVVKHLKLECLDKFLLFDIQPGSETKLLASPPKGDYPGVKIKGDFYEALILQKSAVFNMKGINESLTYQIYITNNDLIIESPYLEKYMPH